MVKRFRCMPVSMGLPIIFLLAIPWWLFLQLWTQSSELLPLTIFFIAFAALMAVLTAIPAARRIEIYPTKIICKSILPNHTYELEYEKCNVGMDYSIVQDGNKLWWIYLCYGPPAKFKSAQSPNRMNAVKFRPGYIKMHYSDDLYNALLEVLPKKQRTALCSARKWADC